MVPSPCYVMEESLLRRNLSLISNVANEAGVEIILAFKAFALWKSFPIFREYINSVTASSIHEARLAYEEFGCRAHAFSPAYTDGDFDEIMRCCSHISFNSLSQYERFYKRVKESDYDISCGIRINPEYSEIETELYNPCAPGSRFGATADLLPDELPEGIDGFHCHCHCESSSYALENTLKHIEEKFGHWLHKIKWLNLGGGHLMTRKDYDVEHLISLLKGLRSRSDARLIRLERRIAEASAPSCNSCFAFSGSCSVSSCDPSTEVMDNSKHSASVQSYCGQWNFSTFLAQDFL